MAKKSAPAKMPMMPPGKMPMPKKGGCKTCK